MNLSSVKPGLRVRITRLGDTRGMAVKAEHLDCRTVGVIGTIKSWVPGHGGDVWWVQHQDGTGIVGAYCYDEFEPV